MVSIQPVLSPLNSKSHVHIRNGLHPCCSKDQVLHVQWRLLNFSFQVTALPTQPLRFFQVWVVDLQHRKFLQSNRVIIKSKIAFFLCNQLNEIHDRNSKLKIKFGVKLFFSYQCITLPSSVWFKMSLHLHSKQRNRKGTNVMHSSKAAWCQPPRSPSSYFYFEEKHTKLWEKETLMCKQLLSKH